MQQGAFMNSEKEQSMNKGGQSDTSIKNKPEQTRDRDRQQSDYKADATRKDSGASDHKFNQQNQSEDRRNKDHSDKSSDII